MAQDDLQKHLDNAMYGTPLLKPEEQKKYMGTFRERCYLTMTIAQMKDTSNKENLLKELTKHPEAFVLLNGAMDMSLQNSYIKLLTAQKTVFTVVNDFVENSPDSYGLILAAKQAVNEKQLSITEKYPPAIPIEKPVKKRFWQNLF